ncbi:hypothetical protein Emed_006314 [Eimeria media]
MWVPFAAAVPRRVTAHITILEDEGIVLHSFPRRRAGEDEFPPDWCPPYVLHSRAAFRRLGPPAYAQGPGEQLEPTFWERRVFFDMRELDQESVFAVLRGPGFRMMSGEPCWLVRCTLRDVYREMVFDRAMICVYDNHDLRRFVEISRRYYPEDMDIDYSYAVAPYRVECEEEVVEDYARKWHAFRADRLNYLYLGRMGRVPARRDYRGPHLLLWVVRRPPEARFVYGPRHPMLPNGRFVDYFHLHTRFPSGRGPEYEPLAQFGAAEVGESTPSEDSEPSTALPPGSPRPSDASSPLPGTSPGSSPSAADLRRPWLEDPPARRRRVLESALFPASPEAEPSAEAAPPVAETAAAGPAAAEAAEAETAVSVEQLLAEMHPSTAPGSGGAAGLP